MLSAIAITRWVISPNDGGPRNFNSIDDSINYAARILSNPDGAYANGTYTIGQLWYTYSPSRGK